MCEYTVWSVTGFVVGVLLASAFIEKLPPKTGGRYIPPAHFQFYTNGRLRTLLRMVWRAYCIEKGRCNEDCTALQGRRRAVCIVAKRLYPMWKITGEGYWETEVFWGSLRLTPRGEPMSQGRAMRLFDYRHDVAMEDWDRSDRCVWRRYSIPMEYLWDNILPDPSHAIEARMIREFPPVPGLDDL